MKKVLLPLAAVCVLAVAMGAYMLARPSGSKHIAVFLPSATNPFWIEVRHGVEEQAAKAKGYTVDTFASGDLDAASQVEQLQTVLARKSASAIVLGVADNRAPAAIVAQYNKASIPVVLIDTKLDAAAAKDAGATWDAFIGSNNREGGRLAAIAVAEAIKGSDKKVLLIKGSYVHQSAIDRAEGFMEGAKGKLQVIERDGEWSRQRASELTSGVINRGSLSGIFASNDDMALGAVAALDNLHVGKDQWPIVIGFDATPAGIKAIQEGKMYASIKQDALGIGGKGIALAIELTEGKKIEPKDQLVPISLAVKH